jgi:repressor LexA
MRVSFTPKQGQYLAFIYYYTKINGRPPAELDMQRYFRVSAPTVHQMVVKLAELGFIERTPGASRSVRVLLARSELPHLE